MAKKTRSERRATTSQTTPPNDLAPATDTLLEEPAADVQAAPVTRDLTPLEAEDKPAYVQPDALTSSGSDASADNDTVEEFDAGATREAVAVVAPPVAPALAEPALAEPDMAEPAPADPDATIVRERPLDMDFAEEETVQQAVQPPISRPKFNTLAGAFSRSRSTPPAEQAGQVAPPEPTFNHSPGDENTEDVFTGDEFNEPDGLADETDPEGEWALADQPTVHLTQDELQALKPSFLDTSEQPASWPPRPAQASAASQAPTPLSAPLTPPPTQTDPRDWRAGLPPRPQPPFDLSAARPTPISERLAAPDGRPVRTPDADSGAPDYRMERFQELRRHRTAHEQGEEATDDITPVAEAVRQWWRDLRPGVGSALQYQREARESGTHPLPAFAPPPPTSRLGDAFGKFAASARELAGPAFKSIHDHVEHAAQGLIKRLEGDPARQQAPFLGPGRVAVFFRRGVTVGQAQRLLAASSARPMRLIPRKHGILAQVMPGHESEVGERLRQHPYVDDVVYMEYGERA